mmetsp:Transcript_47598/g.132720  ORF Transcript_47598/g.132720 Transcript_47598/m.132720 type:complete len:262 (-) Transcript_47598:70-855(-)
MVQLLPRKRLTISAGELHGGASPSVHGRWPGRTRRSGRLVAWFSPGVAARDGAPQDVPRARGHDAEGTEVRLTCTCSVDSARWSGKRRTQRGSARSPVATLLDCREGHLRRPVVQILVKRRRDLLGRIQIQLVDEFQFLRVEQVFLVRVGLHPVHEVFLRGSVVVRIAHEALRTLPWPDSDKACWPLMGFSRASHRRRWRAVRGRQELICTQWRLDAPNPLRTIRRWWSLAARCSKRIGSGASAALARWNWHEPQAAELCR